MRMPLSSELLLRAAMNVTPRTVRANSSGLANVSTSGRTMGMEAASTTAPITAPTPELVSDAPMARPASPRCAMG